MYRVVVDRSKEWKCAEAIMKVVQEHLIFTPGLNTCLVSNFCQMMLEERYDDEGRKSAETSAGYTGQACNAPPVLGRAR